MLHSIPHVLHDKRHACIEVARRHVPSRGRAELSEADVAAGVAERAAARAAKDFAAADAVRVRLAERGIMLMDSAAGTSWRPGVLDQSRG